MNRLIEALLFAVVPRLAWSYLRLVGATMRLSYRNRDALERARRGRGPYILAFWHSRFVMMPWAYPGEKLAVLSSTHRDSRLLARLLERFGLTIVPGSSSSGGAAGFRGLLRRVGDGYDVGITPDGPRGPRRRAKEGVIATARLSGIPIVPVAFSARPARRLASWDRTLVPWPFARGLYVYGEPIGVPREAGPAACEGLRQRLERELDRLTDLADLELGLAIEESRDPK